MDRKALSEAIIQIVNGIIDDDQYKMIIADQSAPRPSAPYGSVKVITMLQETTESTSYGEISGYLSSSQQKVMVSFNFFRDNSYAIASLIRRAFWRREVADLFQEIGLGLVTRGSVENLTESLEANFEERANFIARFNYNEVDYDSEYSQNKIEGATVGGSVDYNGESVPVVIEIDEN